MFYSTLLLLTISILYFDRHYVGSIIGRKGAIKSRIERDTKTEIKIPRQGQSGDVVIFGPSEAVRIFYYKYVVILIMYFV